MPAKKKTIVLVIHDLKGNGAERVILTLADEFIRQGHICNIVCFKDLQELPSSHSIPPSIFPMKLFRWIPRKVRGRVIAPLFDRYIKSKFGSPDLILSNLLPVDRILAHSKLPNVFLVIHSIFSKEFNLEGVGEKRTEILDMLSSIYCRKPLICVSDGAKDDLKNVFKCPVEACRIYNPIDTGFILKQSSEKIDNNLPTEYFLHVGKFNQAKRQDFLIKVYADSKVDTPLVLMGQGPLLMQCKSLVKELGLENKIIFAGFFSNPYPVMKKAKALLVSSDFEGLGMVILEAICLRVPVISTDCESGPREILPSRNLIPVGDKRAYSRAIQDVESSPDIYLSNLNEQFTKEEAIRQYLQLT